ncbi:hypothetical protein HDU83_007971 [Entophlyctis luteolus]|nr:hypothetical protein HDU83_007971 [Entophlyctis luteolus]
MERGVLSWMSGGAMSIEGMMHMAGSEETSATPELLKDLLIPCIDALRKLQSTLDASFEIQPLENATAGKNRFSFVSDSSILALVEASLQAATPFREAPRDEIVNLMSDVEVVLKLFMDSSSFNDSVLGFVRLIELITSKLLCVWMNFCFSEASFVDIDKIKSMRISTEIQKLKRKTLFLYSETDQSRTSQDMERILQTQANLATAPFCMRADDSYHEALVVESYQSTNGIHTEGSTEAGQVSSAFLATLLEKQESVDSIHSFNTMLSLPMSFQKHLIVFVHGLMGSPFDFRILRNQIIQSLRCLNNEESEYSFLLSESNQFDTFSSIEVLSSRLAAEVSEFISSQRRTLGGLIARMAIQNPLLDPFRHGFHLFASLSTPHISLYFQSNYLVGSAMRVWRFVGRAKSVEEINFADNSDPRQCLLYKISQNESVGLEKFKKVKFFGSAQDGYVSIDSATTNVSKLLESGTEGNIVAEACIEMAKRIPASVKKYSVWFGGPSDMLDVLGRRAHISFLTDTAFVELFAFFLLSEALG